MEFKFKIDKVNVHNIIKYFFKKLVGFLSLLDSLCQANTTIYTWLIIIIAIFLFYFDIETKIDHLQI